MIWVLIFGGIALAGVIMLVAYAVWLAHKAADVMSEVGVLADRTGQLVDLLSQIQAPERDLDIGRTHSDLTVSGRAHGQSAT